MTDNSYTVVTSGAGWLVVWNGSWGTGYVFSSKSFADAACRALNDNLALDRDNAREA